MATNKEFNDRLVRRWTTDGTGSPLARWVWTDGNSFDLTFGGTETNGNYVTTINPVKAGVASIPVTTARAGGVPATNDNLATQHVADFNTLLAVAGGGSDPSTVLRTYIQSVSASGAVVSVIVQPGAPAFTVETSAPAPGTLAADPDDLFPITYNGLGYGPKTGARTGVEFSIVPVNSSLVPLDPNGASLPVTIRRILDRGAVDPVTGVPSTPVGVQGSVTVNPHYIGEPIRIPANGGRLSVELGTVVGTITGLDSIEVWGREINE